MKKKKIYWNINNKLEIDQPIIRRIFFRKKIINRKHFCAWIGEISSKNSQNFDWWLTIPSSRNPYISELYDNICVLETIDELIKKNYNVKIKTSSLSLFRVIKKKLKKNLTLEVIFCKKKIKSEFFSLIKTITFYSIIFFYIKIFFKKKILKRENNILAESFLILNINNKENFNQNILKLKNENIFLVLNFLPQKKIFLLLKALHEIHKTNFIFKENYLTFKDYIYSLLHYVRKKKFIYRYKRFNKWDVSPIINNEIKSNKNFYSAITGILNFRFFKNLSKEHISLKKTINLFENNAVGRGWNLGSRTFFPKVENLGYQGYINFSQFMNSHPCQFEEKAKILPNKIAVISKFFKKNKKEFYSKTKVLLAPSLNFKIDKRKIKKINHNITTLILTGIKDIDQKLINWSLKFIKINKKIKLIIKFHPILPKESFDLKIINNFNSRIDVSNEDLSLLLNKSYSIISTGPTTAIYEAFLKKCYLIIPVFDPWDKLNLENCKIPKKNYALAYSFKEFSLHLKNMIKNKKKELKTIKKNLLFEKYNSSTMKVFQ